MAVDNKHRHVRTTAVARDVTTRRRLTLLAMCTATFMIQLDVTIVNVALPAIQAHLGTGSAQLEWVISAYALSLAALIPVSGALGDRYGHKHLFLGGLTVFAGASAGCALAPTAGVLIAGRALQGVGGAAMLALTLAILSRTFTGPARTAAIGTWAAVGGTGFGVGPVVGGVLLSMFTWSSVFWVNVPFAVVAAMLTAVAVPGGCRRPNGQRLDLAGVTMSGSALVALTYGVTRSATSPWLSWQVAGALGVASAALAAFFTHEARTAHPILAPFLVHSRGYVTGCAVYLMAYAGFSGVLFYVSLLYENILGWSALRTGLSWLFMNVPFLALAQLAGPIDRRSSPRAVLTTGCLLASMGVFLLSRAGSDSSFVVTAVGYAAAGVGFGLLAPAVAHLAMRNVPSAEAGAASAVLNACRQLGTSIGVPVASSVAAVAAGAAWSAEGRRAGRARWSFAAQARNVAGARINDVVAHLGPASRAPAAAAFGHGFHLAVGSSAACLGLAACAAWFGLAAVDAPRTPVQPGTDR